MTNQSKTLIQRAIEKIEDAKVADLQKNIQSSFGRVEHSLWAAVSSDLWFFKDGLIKVSDQLHSDIVGEHDTIKSSYSFNNQGMRAILTGAELFKSIEDDVSEHSKSAFVLDLLMELVYKKVKNIFEDSEGCFQYALSLYITASIYKNILISLQDSQQSNKIVIGKVFDIEEHFKEAEERNNEHNGNYNVMWFLESSISSLIFNTEQMQSILRVEKLKEIAKLAIAAIVEVVFKTETVEAVKEIGDVLARLGLEDNTLKIDKGVTFKIYA